MNKNFDLEILENGARNPHYIKELKGKKNRFAFFWS